MAVWVINQQVQLPQEQQRKRQAAICNIVFKGGGSGVGALK